MSNNTYKKLNSDLKFVYSENNTLSIIFQKNEMLLGVVGEFNNNIKELEKITKTKIYSRGNSIIVKSDSKKNELIKNAIQFLSEQLKINGTVFNNTWTFTDTPIGGLSTFRRTDVFPITDDNTTLTWEFFGSLHAASFWSNQYYFKATRFA